MRSLLIVVLTVAALGPAGRAHATPAAPNISAPDAVVIDGWTGAVLWARRPGALHDPASTVKLMTALLILKDRLPLRRVVTISPEAAFYGGSTAGLVVGERITVWNLLHGMLMPSGNDAAAALAEAEAGSTFRFVQMMNREAIRLQLWHTHYLSPNGFDMPGQETSAADLARLARVVMGFPIFARIVRTRWWTARSVDGRFVHHWSNTNRLLWGSRAVNGVKTGTTPGAGACLVSSAREGSRWVIAVNLGSTEATRFHDGALLLDYGLSVTSSPPWAR